MSANHVEGFSAVKLTAKCRFQHQSASFVALPARGSRLLCLLAVLPGLEKKTSFLNGRGQLRNIQVNHEQNHEQIVVP